MSRSTAITIGNFDGVHRGHTALIERARALAGPHGTVLVLAFEPHPLTRLDPQRAPAVLTPHAEKERLVRLAGADELRVLVPDDDLLALSPRAFLERVMQEHRPAWIVEGDDFHYGVRRSGNVSVLRDDARSLGVGAEVVGPVEIALADQSLVRASSTITRWLLARGRVEDAARVLGRPYALTGEVQPGASRGRELGFRTANLHTDQLAPGEGVYAAAAVLPDGTRRPAAVSIGTNPTFHGDHQTIEAHVLDWDGRGAPDYGYPLTLEWISWLRDQRTYQSAGALATQIARDVDETRAAFTDGARVVQKGAPA